MAGQSAKMYCYPAPFATGHGVYYSDHLQPSTNLTPNIYKSLNAIIPCATNTYTPPPPFQSQTPAPQLSGPQRHPKLSLASSALPALRHRNTQAPHSAYLDPFSQLRSLNSARIRIQAASLELNSAKYIGKSGQGRKATTRNRLRHVCMFDGSVAVGLCTF